MIERITQNIIGEMIELDIMDPVNSDMYAYKLTIIIESLITVVTLLIIGLIMREPVIMTVLMLSFMLLRYNTGGLHLDTYLQCYAGTVIMFFTTVLIADHMTMNLYLAAGVAIACSVICFKGFVNHPELGLDSAAAARKKLHARIVLAAEMIIFALFYFVLHFEKAAFSIAAAIILDSILIMVAGLLRQEV